MALPAHPLHHLFEGLFVFPSMHVVLSPASLSLLVPENSKRSQALPYCEQCRPEHGAPYFPLMHGSRGLARSRRRRRRLCLVPGIIMQCLSLDTEQVHQQEVLKAIAL